MTTALLELDGVSRTFASAQGPVHALRDVQLRIGAGEMVAIVGHSGSGKSTLMNLLGCLDTPTTGRYRVSGADVAALGADARAALRLRGFGFVFQHYHLLPCRSALDNVCLPLLYAGRAGARLQARAAGLLARLGLADKAGARPGTLSGGQQQRVGIARALVNGAEVILADEPTGALDAESSETVLRLLHDIHRAGRTVILITHDARVAARAQRIICLQAGRIVDDRWVGERHAATAPRGPRPAPGAMPTRLPRAALRESLAHLATHPLRSVLTALGIAIGVCAVVLVLALGRSTSGDVLARIGALGADTLNVYPGDGPAGQPLTLEDLAAVQGLADVDGATGVIHMAVPARSGAAAVQVLLDGVGDQHMRVAGLRLREGRFFTPDEQRRMAQVVVIDERLRDRLFGPDGPPRDAMLLVRNEPLQVIGVARALDGSPLPRAWMPANSLWARLGGSPALHEMAIRLTRRAAPRQAEQRVAQLLAQRHGGQDFQLLNRDAIRRATAGAGTALDGFMLTVAAISLLVGGIGLANILWLSVSERRGEIGLRMAVGARQRDIFGQFLAEAVLICLLGGAAGAVLAPAAGLALSAATGRASLHYPVSAFAVALGSALAVGLAAGVLPARRAARQPPAAALVKS